MPLTRRVLLLNASYEALGIVTIPRAVRLVWKGSAEVVELDGDRVLRSQHFVFPQPSVVRLIEYIDVRGRQGRSSTKRSRILSRDRYRCQYCGMKGGAFDLTIDHIAPRSNYRGEPVRCLLSLQSAEGQPHARRSTDAFVGKSGRADLRDGASRDASRRRVSCRVAQVSLPGRRRRCGGVTTDLGARASLPAWRRSRRGRQGCLRSQVHLIYGFSLHRGVRLSLRTQ